MAQIILANPEEILSRLSQDPNALKERIVGKPYRDSDVSFTLQKT